MDSAIYNVWYTLSMNEQDPGAMKDRDLSPAEIARATAPKKTWFVERIGDGVVFPCEEQEAWQIFYNKSNWRRRDFRLLGTSDGTTYNKIIKESMAEAKQLEPDIETKSKELQQYMDAEKKLIMDEAVDMEGDPADTYNETNKQKVLRIRKIISRLNTELDTLEARFKEVTSAVVKRATEAELEVAKQNQANRIAQMQSMGLQPTLDWPDQNININTPEANTPGARNKILNLIGK